MSFCVLCAFYHPNAERHYADRTLTCPEGRRQLERDRLTVRSMYLRLAEGERVLADERTGDRVLRHHDGTVTVLTDRPRDPVAHLLPMAATPGRSRQPMVSGSRDRAIPIDVNRVDLTAAAQVGTVTDPYRDQTGHLSVATVLNDWVRTWCERFFPAETPPPPAALKLIDWLGGVRLQMLCESDPAIVDFADQLAGLRRALRGALHENPPRRQVMWGVPCRRCKLVSTLTLDPDDPDRYRECGNPRCGLLLTEQEYRDHLRQQVEQLRRPKDDVVEEARV